MDFLLSSHSTGTINIVELREQLEKAKSLKDQKKLIEVAKACLTVNEWDLAMEALKSISIESERTKLIADLIEEFLIPAHEIDRAKKFVKFLTPQHEMTSLLLFHLSLVEKDQERALKFANELPTPQSRNFALTHLAQFYLQENDREHALKIGDLMLENARTIHDSIQQSYAIRDVIKNLFLACGDKLRAKKAVEFILEDQIKNKLMESFDYQ
jgi:hypothetical protein